VDGDTHLDVVMHGTRYRHVSAETPLTLWERVTNALKKMLQPIADVMQKHDRLAAARTEARVSQRFTADFRHLLPPGYFLINWRVTSPKFRAWHTLEADFIPDFEALGGCGRKRCPAISTSR
jgi:hypothetical protein